MEPEGTLIKSDDLTATYRLYKTDRKTKDPRRFSYSKDLDLRLPYFRNTKQADAFYYFLYQASHDGGDEPLLDMPIREIRQALNIPGKRQSDLIKAITKMTPALVDPETYVMFHSHSASPKPLFLSLTINQSSALAGDVLIMVNPEAIKYFKYSDKNSKRVNYPLQEVLQLSARARILYFILRDGRSRHYKDVRLVWEDFVKLLYIPKSYQRNVRNVVKRIVAPIMQELTRYFPDLKMDVYGLNEGFVRLVVFRFLKYEGLSLAQLRKLDYTLSDKENYQESVWFK